MKLTQDIGPGPLWDFALALYSKPGVEKTALALQERNQVNVSLLLWAAWLDACGVHASEQQITAAARLIDGIDRHWVQPLRKLRRALDSEQSHTNRDPAGAQQALKKSLLEAELKAERWVLAELETFSRGQDWHGGEQRGESVRAYLCPILDEPVVEELVVLLAR